MRTTSKWTAGRETTSKGRRPSSNPARRRTPGSDHAIGTAVDVGSRYDEDDPHDEHQDRDGTEQETEPHLLGHVQPSTWAGVQPARSAVGRAGLLANTSRGSPYRTVNPRGGFAATPSLALAVLAEILVAEVPRRGFEPEEDVPGMRPRFLAASPLDVPGRSLRSRPATARPFRAATSRIQIPDPPAARG